MLPVNWQDIVLGYYQEGLAYTQCLTKEAAGSCYVKYDSLSIAWAYVAYFAIYSFVWSIIGNNCSKVDQIWSITPVLYALHFLAHYYYTHEQTVHVRVALVCVLIAVWGVRLTFNFWRKGGYGNLITHEEDYRWPIIRKKMHPILFFVFNLTFIATYQNVLLFLIAAPVYELAKSPPEQLLPTDYILGGLFVALFLIETIADDQHFRFQALKYSLTAEERAKHPNLDVRFGFFTNGFFRFSRHPNYFAEQSMWVVVYLFSCNFAFAQTFLELNNWTVAGCVLLILLFQGSMNFGESITVAKYPRYADYQKICSQCILWLPHRGLSAEGDAGKKKK